MKDNLREFLRTGAWQAMQVGMTRAEVIAILGQPDDVSTLTDRQRMRHLPPAVLKYGHAEFHFDEHTDLLNMIFIDDLTGWEDVAEMNIEEGEGVLGQLGIAYRRCEGCRGHMGRSLVTAAQVVMQFGDGSEDEGPSPGLAAVYRSIDGGACQGPER